MRQLGSDFFRDPPIRWLGYLHAVGGALPGEMVSTAARPWLSTTTFAYIAFDTIYKAIDGRSANPVFKAVDALIWQGFSSIVVPSLVVGGVARGSNILIQTLKVSKPMNRYIPVGLVLVSMPLFGRLIDETVDYIMDHTTRPLILR